MVRRKTLLILLAIVLLGTFLRLYKLDKSPPSLFGDELDVGYQAYSILKTGKDYLGQPWPLSFHSISDWRTPLFLYSAVPFVAVFGLNEWGVRLSAALFGILTLPIFFLLAKKIFKDEKIGLIATFFLSISIWHLQYSRAAFEVSQMLFLLITGLYFFFKGLEDNRFFPLSAILLMLMPYSYNTAKFFVPILFLLLFFVFKKEILTVRLKTKIVVLVCLILLGLPMARDILFGEGGNRFSILSIFTDPTLVPQIGFYRLEDLIVQNGFAEVGSSPSFSSRIFHNKYLSLSETLLINYFKVFSTDFLFVRGDMNLRHSIQKGFGVFYWLDAVFFLVGISFLFWQLKTKKIKTFLFFWFFLSPIPSILTRDGGGHATRLILLLPPFLLFMAYGAKSILTFIGRKKILLLPIVGFICLQVMLYLHQYYVHYPLDSEEWWNFGFKQTGEYVQKNIDKYDYIIYSDRGEPPLIFTAFWNKIDPARLQEGKPLWTKINGDILADHLVGTKFYFGHVSEEKIKGYRMEGVLKSNYLYIMPGGETGLDYRQHTPPKGMKLLQTVYYPSGRVAKYIFTGE